MSTKAGAIGVPNRPVGYLLWTGAVSVLAAVALIMSVVAITVSDRGQGSAATVEAAPLWDAGKIEAMQGRVLAATVEQAGLWDAGKIEAMQGRVLAE